MRLLFSLLYLVVLAFFLLFLIFRLIMEYVFLLARSYRPTGIVTIVLELAYSVTDPPLKALRRVLPPVGIGSIRLDLAFFVLVLACSLLMALLGNLAA